MPIVWTAGSNIPGYLPESDIAYFSTWADAKFYMLDWLRQDGDALFESGETEDERALADEYSAAAEELNLDTGPEWATSLPSSTSQHDLGIVYWISREVRDDDVR